ncbi:hypothetical protein JX265_010825 [Neoarthrinium moseri]|uniref:Uncharacterized protein n=1 Tax=Neoarthrinium moseri TaxID=1658444 RepID=A0A9P9WD79_9PEZI|nr:hypothetical protein JX265_010825 [Neoarthrinium moseri]
MGKRRGRPIKKWGTDTQEATSEGHVAVSMASLSLLALSASPSPTPTPTLLSIPREVRDSIYGYLLAVDRFFEASLDPGLTQLAVNQQIRAEA